MPVTLPTIGITFTQKAVSLIERSERGIAVLIVRDNTKDTAFYNFKSSAEVPKEAFASKNYQYIMDVYALKQPYRVCIVRIAEDGEITDAITIIEANVPTGWVTVADGTTEDFAALVSWIGTCEQNAKTYKALVYGIAVAPDKKHVVNFVNTKVTFADGREEATGEKYLPSLVGLLAGSNVVSGVTNATCGNLQSVAAVEDASKAVSSGNFILVNDVDVVRVGVGVNSLIATNGSTLTEDMKYIETVEAMDLIADDIRDEYKNNYVGKYRNSYDNQMLFIAAVRYYLGQLAKQNILDAEYGNVVDINIAAQRAAWIGTGKAEASEWSDEEVRRMAFKRTVYLTADIKILGSMEHLTFEINMA